MTAVIDATARALVLDDNRHMRFMLSEMLRGIGFGAVFEAATCEQARDQLDVRSYTIMFADVSLVHETSLGLIREIRAHHRPAIRELPIVVISGQNTANVVLEAREAGASGFLMKPFSVAALTEHIRRALKDGQNDVDVFPTPPPQKEKPTSSLAGDAASKDDDVYL